MRFDWYAATIDEDPDTLIQTLADNLNATIQTSTPRNGYARAQSLHAAGSTVATVLYGGRNGAPHAFASGDDTDVFVPLVRAFWPAHRVSRMDAAEDFDNGPGTWESLFGPVLEVADELGIKTRQAGDWLHEGGGRSFYVGAPKSAVMSRTYEKGIQLQQLAVDGGAGEISPFLVRQELQVRPAGIAKQQAAFCAPEHAYGFAEWSQVLLSRVLGLDVERVHIRARRESDADRALDWMLIQYGAALELRAVAAGGWAKLGDELEQRLVSIRARRAASRRN